MFTLDNWVCVGLCLYGLIWVWYVLVYGFDLCVWFDLVYGFDMCFVVLDKKLKPTMENKVTSFKNLDAITYNFLHSFS